MTSLPPAAPSDSALRLLADMAPLLGLPPSQAPRLAAPNVFTGPSGLACRLLLQPGGDSVRPEVLLPVRAREFRDERLERLLKVQALLLDQLGWYLGLSSEGMLSLMPLAWLSDAPSTAAALDMANGVAMAALSALIADDGAVPGAGR